MTAYANELLQEQLAYYRARASEYDAAYAQRIGLDSLATELSALRIEGDVLELACGTGQWTKLLSEPAQTVTALDAAPEMLKIARERLGDTEINFIEADLFQWQPSKTYDTVFFAFWLTHVPSDRFEDFWKKVWNAVSPRGQVIFIDDGPRKMELEDSLPALWPEAVRRRLSDGRSYRAAKVLYDPQDLQRRLRALGWRTQVKMSGLYHIVGVAAPPISPWP